LFSSKDSGIVLSTTTVNPTTATEYVLDIPVVCRATVNGTVQELGAGDYLLVITLQRQTDDNSGIAYKVDYAKYDLEVESTKKGC